MFPYLGDQEFKPPAVEEWHLCSEQDSEVSSSIETHILICGGEQLVEDNLRVYVVGKVQRGQDELHQVRSVLIVAYVQ